MQEEQRVIEAKIRMRQQEIQDEEERMQKRQELDSGRRHVEPAEVETDSVNGIFRVGLCLLCVLGFFRCGD